MLNSYTIQLGGLTKNRFKKLRFIQKNTEQNNIPMNKKRNPFVNEKFLMVQKIPIGSNLKPEPSIFPPIPHGFTKELYACRIVLIKIACMTSIIWSFQMADIRAIKYTPQSKKLAGN
jgi:hypothetical protein